MHGRHVAPRHRSPQSLKRTLGRFAVDATSRLPASGAARLAVVLGAAGVAVGGGVLTVANAPVRASAVSSYAPSPQVDSEAESLLATHAGSSLDELSRSAERPPLSVEKTTKTAALPVSGQNVGGGLTASVAAASPREIAMSLLPSYGWDSGQFSCLDAIWTRESNWNTYADNPSSGAYGIPQSLPGSKMATYGSDWATNPETQIKWGLAYIKGSYGSPCGAWSFWESHSWY